MSCAMKVMLALTVLSSVQIVSTLSASKYFTEHTDSSKSLLNLAEAPPPGSAIPLSVGEHPLQLASSSITVARKFWDEKEEEWVQKLKEGEKKIVDLVQAKEEAVKSYKEEFKKAAEATENLYTAQKEAKDAAEDSKNIIRKAVEEVQRAVAEEAVKGDQAVKEEEDKTRLQVRDLTENFNGKQKDSDKNIAELTTSTKEAQQALALTTKQSVDELKLVKLQGAEQLKATTVAANKQRALFQDEAKLQIDELKEKLLLSNKAFQTLKEDTELQIKITNERIAKATNICVGPGCDGAIAPAGAAGVANHTLASMAAVPRYGGAETYLSDDSVAAGTIAAAPIAPATLDTVKERLDRGKRH